MIYPVFSWDNLSTKGLVHVQPDAVLVWNDRQRTEAVEMHQCRHDAIVVTGAPRFDEFFAMTPKTTREAVLSAASFRSAAADRQLSLLVRVRGGS